MKVFALITLRCALIMLLSSFVQNEPLGTLATLALRDWEYSCYKIVNIVSVSPGFITLDPNYINEVIKKPLTDLLNEVNNFPIGGMDELLDRRLKKPLGLAIGNCDQLLNEVEHSGRQDNKKYLESLSSKIRSIAKGIRTEFNTFTMEVELELIKKVNWTSGNKKELEHRFSNLYKLSKQIESYCDPESFNRAAFWVSRLGRPQQFEPGTPEFVEGLVIRILNAKLGILKRELHAKIARFVEQPHIDGDEFIAFCHNFKLEWNQIDQMTRQLTSNDDKDTLRERLDNLAEKAMEETAPLKAIITENFDQLMTKCQNSLGKLYKEEASKQRVAAAKGMGPSKPVFFKVGGSNKSKEKKEAKKKAIDAMKEIISDIGMFDGAAYKLLVRFERGEFGKTDFCAKLKKAVAEDKKMVSTAYQVKDNEL